MSFLTKIKLGNVTNLSDARYAAAVGINYIGFCFDPSGHNYIAPIKAKEMMDWITGSYIVAEFGHQSFSEINDISELLNVNVIELDNRLLPDELPAFGKPIIKKIDISVFDFDQLKTEIESYKEVCDAFHLYNSGLPTHLTEMQLKELFANNQVIWGFDVSDETIKEIINVYQPFALNISGGMEEKTGIKDFDELNELLDTITIED
ncbi:MAG: hypothetical protein V4658_01580 [Bacteroidota bacterium]